MGILSAVNKTVVMQGFITLQDKNRGCGPLRGGPGEGYTEFTCVTADHCTIAGWYHPDFSRRGGTLIYLHGVLSSCVAEGLVQRLKKMRKKAPTMATAAIDLRGHGRSGHFLPSLGIAEVQDIRAAILHLQEQGFPAPFILMGDSMGGMVAAVAAMFEPLVSAAICVMPPAAPLVGMQSVPAPLRNLLISAVNDSYAHDVFHPDGKFSHRYDILLQGDLTFHECSPAHRPRLLYLMGDKDPYDCEKTIRVWRHLYKNEEAVFDANRSAAPHQNKWFRVARGFGHDLHRWGEFDKVVNDFLKYELK